jgi:acyl-homoserine-lactone acylase
MWKPIEALSQSFLRTKARDFASFVKAAELRANSSNATIYADADGTIAYFHPQFVPRRDDRFDYGRPVDGSDPATDWRGLTPLDSLPFVRNPSVGWIQNTNNWPYSASGPDSPKRERFPKYMDDAEENARGLHAMRVLEGRKDFTVQKLIDAAYDTWLPAFADLVPAVVKDFDALAAADPQRVRVAEQVAALRTWDHRWGVASVPTSLAVYWGEELLRRVRAAGGTASPYPYFPFRDAVLRLAPAVRLEALAAASDRLTREFGAWRTPWGEINRFQRLTSDIVQKFDDAAPSLPVGFPGGGWGTLASFGARQYPGTKRWYGTSGNSFVAVVEFGRDSVRARAVTAGGESGDPKSRHFNDQAARYATGDLRPVYFYPGQLVGHTERTYRP